ncbi:MAG: hypothetical protein ACE5H1_09275, partial [Thermodesulfobacteriota bacterium]
SSDTVGDTLHFFLILISHSERRITPSDRNKDNEPDTVKYTGPDQATSVPLIIESDGSGASDVDGDLLKVNQTLVSTPEGGTTKLLNLPSVTSSSYVNTNDKFILKINIEDAELDTDSAIMLIAISEIFFPLPDAASNNNDKSASIFQLDRKGQLLLESLAPANLPKELKPRILDTIQDTGVIFFSPFPKTFLYKDNISRGNDGESRSLNQPTGEYAFVGFGQFNTHGTLIETKSGLITTDRHAPLPKTPKGDSLNAPLFIQYCSEPTLFSTGFATEEFVIELHFINYGSMNQPGLLRSGTYSQYDHSAYIKGKKLSETSLKIKKKG